MENKTFPAKVLQKTVADEQDISVDQFLNSRFLVIAKQHNSAVIFGSSASNMVHQEEDIVLDACALGFYQDKNQVTSGMIQCTVDGLGGGESSVCQGIANMSHKTCELFHDDAGTFCETNFQQKIYELASASIKLSERPKRCSVYQATCTLSGAVVYRDKGLFANIGDSMTIVVDGKTLDIKAQLPARVNFRGFGVWSPTPLQALALSKKDRKFASPHLLTKTLCLAQGDLIFQMTDGVWGELPCDDSEELTDGNDIPYIESSINKLFFETLLKSNCPVSAPAFRFAATVIQAATKASLDKRKRVLVLLSKLSPYFDGDVCETRSVKEWVEQCEDKSIVSQLQDYLQNPGHDGCQFYPTAPISLLYQYLKSHAFGDCSTISVMRVPYRCDELIRALSSDQSNKLKLLRELFRQYDNSQIFRSIERLSSEAYNDKCESYDIENLANGYQTAS